MPKETILILDFGGQYKELIARRVRQLGVYSEIRPGSTPAAEIRSLAPIGLIFTGGPGSVYKPGAPVCDRAVLALGIPVLGICYGMQLMAHLLGGEVSRCKKSEYGRTRTTLDPTCPLFAGMERRGMALMSHTDQVSRLPEGFAVCAATAACPVAAAMHPERKLFAVQFHPEVEITDNGAGILRNFVYGVCNAKGGYSMENFIETQCRLIREQVGEEKVLLALSGGVDSSVCAALLSRAVPGQLTCIFVDHGCMRLNEGDEIESVFSRRDLTFLRVNAGDVFLRALRGVADPERKRKIIGATFIDVFRAEAARLGDIPFLAQGTIYPDVIESGGGNAAVIKSHHNVGGMPEEIGFRGVVEPLRSLFKDEVRQVGRMLGLPEFLVQRQPFPGPGLAIRVLGEVTEEKLDLLRRADAIWREEIGKLRKKPDQYFAVLTDMRSVGVMGDGRTYEYVLALRAVSTGDFMTCVYAPLPHSVLRRASARITSEVKGISRVVFDITDKPPATIEWE